MTTTTATEIRTAAIARAEAAVDRAAAKSIKLGRAARAAVKVAAAAVDLADRRYSVGLEGLLSSAAEAVARRDEAVAAAAAAEAAYERAEARLAAAKRAS